MEVDRNSNQRDEHRIPPGAGNVNSAEAGNIRMKKYGYCRRTPIFEGFYRWFESFGYTHPVHPAQILGAIAVLIGLLRIVGVIVF